MCMIQIEAVEDGTVWGQEYMDTDSDSEEVPTRCYFLKYYFNNPADVSPCVRRKMYLESKAGK